LERTGQDKGPVERTGQKRQAQENGRQEKRSCRKSSESRGQKKIIIAEARRGEGMLERRQERMASTGEWQTRNFLPNGRISYRKRNSATEHRRHS
jgi:hypothetical protein